jgi:hypothetical protein
MPNTGLAKRPFRARIPKAYKDHLTKDALRTGEHRGLFFTSSGALWVERINPSREYEYLFRTDGLVDIRVPIPIPTGDGQGILEKLSIVVAGKRDEEQGDIVLGEDALRRIDYIKQERMSFLYKQEKEET